jgi:16S rRNA (guanine(966)-N(2))-methyltransferase RsmD
LSIGKAKYRQQSPEHFEHSEDITYLSLSVFIGGYNAGILASGDSSATFTAMRIIAGEFRGRQIMPPQGEVTRPITDRAKQSLFDVLAPRVEGSRVYDCFAGTGSMGLECLSRGAAHVTFFEADRSALARLAQNIAALRVTERTRTIPGDLFKWFDRAATRPADAQIKPVDLVFLDPPYRFLAERSDEIIQLAFHLTRGHVNKDAIVIFRHDVKDKLDLPNMERNDLREYGDMAIELLRATPDVSEVT